MLAVNYINSIQEENRKYAEAKHDVKKAIKSLNELTPQQRSQLLRDLAAEQAIEILVNRKGADNFWRLQ